MRVIVVGMGEVGRHIAQVLQKENIDVVAIDMDEAALALVEEHHDVATLLGYGGSPGVLARAGADQADLVVAVTNHDEVNLVAALAGKQLGARRAIARLKGKEYGHSDQGVLYGFLGIDVVVNPRILVAQEIGKIAHSHGALDVLGLVGNRVEVVQVEVPARSRVLHKPLSDLSLPDRTLVAAVVRDGELFVPGGADVLLPGDRAYLVGLADHMDASEDLFSGRREAARVCIIGGGVVGEALARNLMGSKVELLIIEHDLAHAEQLSADLPEVTVLHGDGTDLRLLEEEGIGSYDLFCALTHEDEVNLMSGLLARRLGAQRTISLVHRPDYLDIHRQLGIDVVLSPRLIASEHILKYLRLDEVKSIVILEQGQAEVLEMVATEGSRIVGAPIKRLSIPRGALLCAIVRSGQVQIPRGDDQIQAGDTVVVLTIDAVRGDVERLFRRRVI